MLDQSRDRAFGRWERDASEARGDPLRDEGPVLAGELTISDAVALALLDNKSLAGALKQRDVTEGQIKNARSSLFPVVTLAAGYTRLDPKYETTRLLDQYQTSLRVDQLLYTGGRLQAAIRGAQLERDRVDEAIRQQQEAVAFETVTAYLDALLAQHMVQVKADAVASARKHLEQSRKRYQNDVATEYDVLRAKVDVAVFEAEEVQQRNRLHLAKASLFRAMGAAQDSEVQLVDALHFAPVHTSQEEALAQAQRARPELRAAQLLAEQSEERVRLAAADYLPRISAFGTGTLNHPDPLTPLERELDDETTVGVALEWTLFAGGARDGDVETERARLEQQILSLLDTREQIRYEVRQAYLSVQDQAEFVASQRENTELANRGLELVQAGADAEVNTALDVLDARTALTRAKGLYYQSLHAHSLARLSLHRAMGKLRAAVLQPPANETPTPTETR